MRFKGQGSKKLNITFIGEDALNNLSYAKEVIDKRLKQSNLFFCSTFVGETSVLSEMFFSDIKE